MIWHQDYSVDVAHCIPNFLCAFIWDEKGGVLLNFLCMGTTVNSECCTETQRILKACVCRVRLTKCLQCYSSMIMQGHTRVCTTEAIRSYGWTVLPYTLQFLPCTIRLSPACRFQKGPVRTSLCLDEAIYGLLFPSLTNSDFSVYSYF